MASKTSPAEPPPVLDQGVLDMAELGQRLSARRAALGNPKLPRNSGKRRTASKQALLKAVEDAGGKW